jgi:hypothetical protein
MTLDTLHFGFLISLATLVGVLGYGWANRRRPWGIPVMAVCGTVLFWYHGDALYNDYEAYAVQFPPEAITAAWWQITSFLLFFCVLAPVLHAQVNRSLLRRPSTVASVLAGQLSLEQLQPILSPMLSGFAVIWLGITAAALVRTDFDWQGVLFPWMGHVSSAWNRPRIGGTFDFIITVVTHVNLFSLSGFGIVAAVAKSPRLRTGALVLMALSWPTVLFDRTRHTMLLLLLPGLTALVFVRLRRHRVGQAAVLVGAFAVISVWFSFVMSTRSTGSVAAAFASEGVLATAKARHEGLNMFEELCWINKFIEDGTCPPNWGRRYFAEAVNFVPRALWPSKPTIGLDYAVARGQGTAATIGSFGATISTGMIGGGVNNFGPWLGPPAAALLMAGWVSVLARLDLSGQRFGRLLLYIIGLALTFNLGRDITLLVAYPLIFGYVVIWCFERWLPRSARWVLAGRSASGGSRHSGSAAEAVVRSASAQRVGGMPGGRP